MIKFQKDGTTPEQSERLLELGVPADSADCYFNEWQHENIRGSDDLNDGFFLRHPECFPCWSVGRLMEIIDICALGENSDPNTEEYPSTIKVMNKLHIPYVEYLVKSIERAVQLGTIDFSKLDIQ